MATSILSELLQYDTSSPSGLRWRVDRGFGGGAVAGDCAGKIHRGKSPGARWIVKVNGRAMYAHRVIWEIVFGQPVPKTMQIDHIDGDGLNNSIENLRVVPNEVNCRNRAISTSNTSGVVGVRYYARSNGYYATSVDLDGKRAAKFFSCQKYGKEEAFAMAREWRLQMLRSLNERGAGYTDRHIKQSMR